MKRLSDYLASQTDRPFDWRTFNCCHFATGWVKEVTGVDHMAGLPETASFKESRRLLERLGGTLADVWTARLGQQPLQTPRLAQVGDVVALEVPEAGSVVGICAGTVAAVATMEGAIAFLPMSMATHAWRIEPCRA